MVEQDEEPKVLNWFRVLGFTLASIIVVILTLLFLYGLATYY